MMEGRRITVSPRSCCSHRVVTSRKRPRGFINSVKRLQRREICSRRDPALGISNAHERFRNFDLKGEYDIRDPKGHSCQIIDIVSVRDIIFALAHTGICAAFSREGNHRICSLNLAPDEFIDNLFYNKKNDSLITVSKYASDESNFIRCRTTGIECIKGGKQDAGSALFESESLKWGTDFVEFDDINGKVLTYAAQNSIYKVFDLKEYTLLYTISDKNVQHIKFSPGIMLLVFTRASSYVPLTILSMEDGTVLKSFNHLLHRNKKVDFIEQFNEKLLVKQENENLQILDVRNGQVIEVSGTEYMTPSDFIFLYEHQLFLTLRNRTVAVWNVRGELVTYFEDHSLRYSGYNYNVHIRSVQDIIISYCKADPGFTAVEESAGSINISNILNGKCLAKIRASTCQQNDASKFHFSVAEALDCITALSYNEERNEIYTGNRHGLVHVWSN